MNITEELLQRTSAELAANLNALHTAPVMPYYNAIAGDAPVLLAGLLQQLLVQESAGWKGAKWVDDSLITSIEVQGTRVAVEGVIIWGVGHTTGQYTEPFYFEMALADDAPGYKGYTFLFGDHDRDAISYEKFRAYPEFWKPQDRNWKFEFTSGS